MKQELDFKTEAENCRKIGKFFKDNNIAKGANENPIHRIWLNLTSDNGVFKFDFTNFNVLDTTTGIYNISVGVSTATPVDFKYYNDLFDYNGNELILSSNESLLLSY